MSEQSGGPGWWQASDGKWYPPEQAPTAPQPAVGPTGPPPVYGAPPAAAPGAGVAAAGGGGAGKVVAIVVVLALLAGGGAYLLTKGGGGGSTASFCDTAKKFQSDADLNSAFDDPAKIDKTVDAFDQLTKSAPSEIKADMNTINDAIKKIAAAVKQSGNASDPSAAFGAILAASATLDQAKLTQAQQNVDKFGKDKCGIDFSSSSDSSFSFTNSFSSFDTESFESSLSSFSSEFSTFDSSSFESSLSSQSSSLCERFPDACSSFSS